MNIVAVMAHPDDEAFAVSGTVKLLTQAGHRVSFIETTDGDAGRVDDSAMETFKLFNSIKMLRRSELEKSAQVLGVKQIYYLENRDGSLNNADVFNNFLVKDIKEKLIEEKAEVVIAYDHTGVSYHIDHIVTSLATCKACYELPEIVDKVFLFSKPASMNPTLNSSYPYVVNIDFPVTHTVDVQSVIDAKKMSLMSHESQRGDWERFFKNVSMQSWSREDFYLAQDRGRNDEIFSFFKKALNK